jgi:hypothetical protein
MYKYITTYACIIFIIANAALVSADNNALAEIIIKASIGSADGQIGYKEFSKSAWVEPTAIAVDSKENVYVADTLNDRVQKYSSEGKYLHKISTMKPHKRSNEYANDITVDYNDNLYIFIKNAQIIYMYNPSGNLMKAIKYDMLLDADKIEAKGEGSIYLYSSTIKRLYKISQEGKIESSWNNVASYFLEVDGSLFISNNKVSWEKYGRDGKLVGPTVCDKENIKVYFPQTEGGACHFPPQFVDRYGNSYFMKNEEGPKTLTSVLSFNRAGKYVGKLMLPFSADTYPQSNLLKFGNDGNFYAEYGYIQDGFQVMRANTAVVKESRN